MAMVLRRLGYSVALLEKGAHPRFAIGESSTPFANLLLERLAEDFDLPFLRALAEWGTWQDAHRELGCGLKRGFTFYSQKLGQEVNFSDRAKQLLVAASPNDRVADTHWYRPDFDAFLVSQAREAGVDYREHTRLESCARSSDRWAITVVRQGTRQELRAGFVIDASGSAGCLAKQLSLPNVGFQHMPRTVGVFAHFRNVARLDELCPSLCDPNVPYPPDDAAVHHVFENGWAWVLRFNNGIVSAGAALKNSVSEGQAAEEIWNELSARYPTLGRQFVNAEPVTPMISASPLSFRRTQAAGAGWALLPSAAAFVDPLLSTGFALTLLGVRRLAELFRGSAQPLVEDLERYSETTLGEADAVADLVGALYSKMNSFEEFSRLSLLYFAAMSFTETAWRLDKEKLATGFLLTNDRRFSSERQRLCSDARNGAAISEGSIQNAIAPWDIAGLRNAQRQNWYPVRVEDLVGNRSKLGASEPELAALFRKIGVTPVEQNGRSQ